MADRLDLSALPGDSYWRIGVPDLIAAEADLSTEAVLNLMRRGRLKIELRIEDVPIDPLTFVQHLHEFIAARTVLRLHEILDPLLDKLEGDEAAAGAAELLDLARGVRRLLDAGRLDAEG
jgi:hypothetical protein